MTALALLGTLIAASAASDATARPVIELAEVTGSIDPGSGEYLIDAIRGAQQRGAEALIVRLDTPGGLLSTTREVVQEELSAKVPIIFWVGPPGARAGSAGVFLTLAAHVAAMAPSTNIGAAHPVGLGGTDPDGDKDEKHEKKSSPVMLKKIENDTAAFVQGIAERRSRNVEWAIQSVRESVSITASKALEMKVIDLVAEDVPSLLKQLDGRKVRIGDGDTRTLRTAGAEIRPLKWTVRDEVLHGLANPEIAYLIAMLGVLGILAELYHPGAMVPGIVGAICLLIAGMAFQMLPIRMGAAALILVALGLFAAELKVGGHGGFIAGGAGCLVIGSLLLVGHVSPGFYADSDFGLSWKMVAPVGLAFGLIAWGLANKLASARLHKPMTGGQELIGETGVVREEVGPDAGRIMVAGELWNARSAQLLPVGTKARVLSVDGLRLEVASATAELPSHQL
jgi:membrane-bound serine protease (ClpP class)